jgi:hypothetical protein
MQRKLQGVEAVSIHGGKDQEERNEAIRLYKEGKKDVLVATDIAAKGLDFPDIQHVINFDMPGTCASVVVFGAVLCCVVRCCCVRGAVSCIYSRVSIASSTSVLGYGVRAQILRCVTSLCAECILAHTYCSEARSYPFATSCAYICCYDEIVYAVILYALSFFLARYC